MLALDFIRKNPDEVRRAGELKGEAAPVDEVLDLDRRWRECLTVAENARAGQKQLSQQYSRTRAPEDLDRAKRVGEDAKTQMARAEELKRELDQVLLTVPNVFHSSVPIGSSEADNVVLREWGSKPEFEFEP